MIFKIIYPALELINQLVFKTCGLCISDFEAEQEGRKYAACNFQLNKTNVKFRLAKITPTKSGQFVTIWKRNETGTTQPFDINDNFYFYIIAARQQKQFGIFIFSKFVMHENRILSDKTRDGKLGFRIYPRWDLTTRKQAQRTQLWQSKYFLDISNDKLIDIQKAKSLFETGM